MSDTSFFVFVFRTTVSIFTFVLKVLYLAVKAVVKAVVWIGKKLYHLGDDKVEPEQLENEHTS